MRQEANIAIDEQRSVYAVTEGEGPDVLLVHGALGTSHDWLSGPFDQLVREGWRVTAIDRPGHGRSRRPRFAGTPREQAEQIRTALAKLRIDRPVIVGHSFGALVALAFAELFPAEVRQIVLVAPLAFPEPRLLEHSLLAPRSVPLFGPAFSRAAEATIDRPVLKLAHKLMFSPQQIPEQWDRTYPYDQILTSAGMVMEGEDAAAVLPLSPAGTIDVARIETPAIILTGTDDKIVEDERQAKMLGRLMPNARIVEVEGAGHMLHQVRPELIVDAVREALAPA